MKNKSTRVAVLRKLDSLKDYALRCLREKSKDIGLSEKTLFFQTAQSRIIERYELYYDGINCRDGSRLGDFLKDVLPIIQSLPSLVYEDYFAT